jgi:ubiquinone/menaquinone biosynthesis C-methylase UbiE
VISITSGFDWKGLKENAVVVDVGGGVGSQSMALARHFTHLRFVLEDRESVLNEAVTVRY